MAPGGAMLMHQALSQLMQQTLPEHDVHCTVLPTPAAGLGLTGPGPARRAMRKRGTGGPGRWAADRKGFGRLSESL